MTDHLYTKDSPEPPASVTVLEETDEGALVRYLVRQDNRWVWNRAPVPDPFDGGDQWEAAASGAVSLLRVHTTTETEAFQEAWEAAKNGPTHFITLDSGARATFPSGMQRDTQDGKPRYDLIPLWFLRELAELLARGAEKYGDRNWEQANSPEEADRMDSSGLRHHYQYLERDKTENHLAATVFNLFAAEQTRRKAGNP